MPKRKSKYMGQVFDNGWKVTAIEIAGRYGARNKAKGNSYNYVLSRMTSDGECDKFLTVGHNLMVKIARGLRTVEAAEANKNRLSSRHTNSSYYKFLAD